MDYSMSDEMINLVEQGYSFSSTLIRNPSSEGLYKEYTLYLDEEEVFSKTAGVAVCFSFKEMVEEYKCIRREKILTDLGI